MRPAAIRLSLISALLLGSGAHWVALQSFAWAAMTLKSWRQAPLERALAETFNGKSPCGVCLTVSAGLESQEAPQARASAPKADFIVPGEAPSLAAASCVFARPAAESAAPRAALPPPTPPPRSLPA